MGKVKKQENDGIAEVLGLGWGLDFGSVTESGLDGVRHLGSLSVGGGWVGVLNHCWYGIMTFGAALGERKGGIEG